MASLSARRNILDDALESRDLKSNDMSWIIDSLCRDIGGSVIVSPHSLYATARRAMERGDASPDQCLLVAANRLCDGSPGGCLDILFSRSSGLNVEDAWPSRLAGHAFAAMSHYEDAVAHLSRAVFLTPFAVDCWALLGKIHESVNRPERAIAYYRRGLTFEEHSHDCAISLSRLLMRTNRTRRAMDTLRNSLQRDQRSPELHLELAKILRRRANRFRRRRQVQASETVLQGAAECLSIAAAAKPTARTYLQLGIVHERLGRFEAAEAAFRKVSTLDPENTVALLRLANASLEAGRVEEAVATYEKVLTLHPNHASAHFRYSRSRRFNASVETDDYIKQLNELIDRSQSQTSLIQLHFAIAKAYDDSGNFDLAWQHYDRANRLKSGHSESIMPRQEKRRRSPSKFVAEPTIRFFNRQWFGTPRETTRSELPIFIVGMPRSGTTLIEQVLSSHSRIDGAGELKDIERIRHRLISRKKRAPAGDASTTTGGDNSRISYPSVLASLTDADFERAASVYLEKLTLHRKTGDRVTDKMPTNFLHLGLIATLFPKATIVHCYRNPLDVIVSCYCQNLTPPFCDLNAIVEYYKNYVRLMDHWKSVLPMPIHTVVYESFIDRPEEEARKLVAACGLDWEPACLNFAGNDRSVRTPSKWQVRQPIYRTSMQKWKRFEGHLSAVKEALLDG